MSTSAPPAAPDPVSLELFTNRFGSIAAEMGEMLRRSALSTNVKERLDFSCALLDARGRLVVNAPHIPVHLGALGRCVRAVAEHLQLGPGDVAVTNHPAFGGSHLPDITVITPIFESEGALLGYAASRAHHAELGGKTPGSMPPYARCLAEEGVVLEPRLLVAGGEARWQMARAWLTAGRWPSRAPAENLADLRAAVAANRRGAQALVALAAAHGGPTVREHMEAIEARAERLARRALERAAERLGHRPLEARDALDDGTPVCARIEWRGKNESGDTSVVAAIDFAGSGAMHPGNLNATPAIATSAVLYVLRLLVDEPVPLNEGLLRPIDLRLPDGSLLSPRFHDEAGRLLPPERAPAVVGGNVETSQRIVDVLLQAFGLAACSQGTMNNLLFGNERFGYYETICGGAGAGPGFAGADAVHTHMTNTRITDPEILEHRYPVRVERFAVRRGSGGAGRWSGGDGVVRELTFLEPLEVSLLTQRRTQGPPGAAGGASGLPGHQRLTRAVGAGRGEVRSHPAEELPSSASLNVGAGDRLTIETPGGGGWGTSRDIPENVGD